MTKFEMCGCPPYRRRSWSGSPAPHTDRGAGGRGGGGGVSVSVAGGQGGFKGRDITRGDNEKGRYVGLGR